MSNPYQDEEVKTMCEAAFEAGNLRGSEAAMRSNFPSREPLPPDFDVWWELLKELNE